MSARQLVYAVFFRFCCGNKKQADQCESALAVKNGQFRDSVDSTLIINSHSLRERVMLNQVPGTSVI